MGGTGEFVYAQGVVNRRVVQSMNHGVNIVELDIRVVSGHLCTVSEI